MGAMVYTLSEEAQPNGRMHVVLRLEDGRYAAAELEASPGDPDYEDQRALARRMLVEVVQDELGMPL
jgi:hypothetical protein